MRSLLAFLILFLIVACGGGASTTSSTNPPPLPPANNAPTISGAAPVLATVGQAYSFTPTASDADGDTLTFQISNQPAWTSFDATSGSLSGTPEIAHIGSTTGVTITASDGTDSASLPPFDITVEAVRLGSAIVSWDIPTTNADGSNLADLAGFFISYGQASGSYTRTVVVNDQTQTSASIEDLEAGTWYFVVLAYDLAGNESAPSTEVSKLVVP